MLKFKITTEPTATQEPLTNSEAMQQCRLTNSDLSADENLAAELTRLIVAARKYAENATGKSLAEKTVTAVCDSFPANGVIELPVNPIKELVSLTYKKADGSTSDITSLVIVDDFSNPSRLVLKVSSSWPTDTLYEVNPIVIIYKAGETPGGNIKAAMLLMIGHWFDHREEVVIGQESFSIPFGAEALLGQERHPFT